VEQSPDEDPKFAKEDGHEPDQPQRFLYQQMLGIPMLHRSKGLREKRWWLGEENHRLKVGFQW
jgi:hypothetical protein